MLPHTDDFPTFGAEQAVDLPVALDVARDLLPPEGGAGLGPSHVLGATVPETTVYKHRELEYWKDKVGLARQLRTAPPAGDAMRLENLNEPQFCVLVARSSDS